MKNNDLTFVLLVDQTPEEAFNAINNVRGWWTENLVGNTTALGDEFSVKFWDVHYSNQKLVEVIPNEKIVWLITESQLNFLEDKTEWNSTSISFDISQKSDQTVVRFTHHGLTPGIKCYKDCSNAWGGYITKSLYNLITTGKGQPTEKEVNA
jgi:hypothetical protein